MDFGSIANIALTIFAFGVLIVFHEYGHYLLARLSGMRVERFSVGFGPTLFAKTVGETEYVICALPLGGYVKITGMDPSEEGAQTDPRSYMNKGPFKRLAVIAAGPIFNYILAAFLFMVVLLMGPAIADTSTSRVGEVLDGQPAKAAGLEKGDVIKMVDDVPIANWDDFQKAVFARADKASTFVVDRGGEEVTLEVTPGKNTIENPETGEPQEVGMVGVLPSAKRGEGRPFGEAVVGGVAFTWDWNVKIVTGLWKIVTGTQEANLQGPVAIIKRTSQAAEEGMVQLLILVAIISVHLGLFNLLPVPALDGGRLVFLGIEVIRRRPVNARIEMAVHAVGLVVLLGLMLVITIGDIRNIFGS